MATRSASVSVVGLARLRRDLRGIGADLADLKDANQRAAGIVQQAAASRAPRRSGKLAASGRASRTAGRATVMFGGARIPYAGPVHWGWPARGIEPDPFIPDAAQATESLWLPAYEADLNKLAGSLDGHRY
jgi:hypothetical protein